MLNTELMGSLLAEALAATVRGDCPHPHWDGDAADPQPRPGSLDYPDNDDLRQAMDSRYHEIADAQVWPA